MEHNEICSIIYSLFTYPSNWMEWGGIFNKLVIHLLKSRLLYIFSSNLFYVYSIYNCLIVYMFTLAFGSSRLLKVSSEITT